MKHTLTRTNLRISTVLGIVLALMAPASALGISPELSKQVIQSVDDDADRLIEIFKDFHQNPELGFMETRTAGIVASEFESLGFEVQTGIGQTGVVGIMRNGDGPVVLYRGEMDALPIEETTGVPWASNVRAEDPLSGAEVPVAHLCGHDAHTTWMLSVARTMATFKDSWSGTLIMLGQPSEESLTGADAMVDDGLWTTLGVPQPDYALGMHSGPLPLGTLISAGGPLTAGSDQIDVTFRGVGGHGSQPQATKDPVIMAAYAIAQYQAIVSRVVDPREPAVITVGAVDAGIAGNVIPDSAKLRVNTRWFNADVAEQLLAGIEAVSEGVARTYGMPEDELPVIERQGRAWPVINDADLTNRNNQALLASGVIPENMLITETQPFMGSEDYGNLFIGLENVQSGYKFLGIVSPEIWAEAQAEGKAVPWTNHNPNYLVDLPAIPLGAKIAGIMVMDLMAK